MLVDGRRPLLGEGVPRGAVGAVLRDAPCDVAVLVAKGEDHVLPGPGAPVVVPFGGAEHDWAALELAAWICAATSAPLKLLGAAGQTEERATRQPPARRRRPAGAAVRRRRPPSRWWPSPGAREWSTPPGGPACW